MRRPEYRGRGHTIIIHLYSDVGRNPCKRTCDGLCRANKITKILRVYNSSAIRILNNTQNKNIMKTI